jgi:nucleoid-associated protein YgaU
VKTILLLVVFSFINQVFPEEVPYKGEKTTLQDELQHWKVKSVFFRLEKHMSSQGEKIQSLWEELDKKKQSEPKPSDEEVSKLTKQIIDLLKSSMKASIIPSSKEWGAESDSLMREAEIAFADSLAQSDFLTAKELDLEARSISAQFSKKMETIEAERDPVVKEELWNQILENAYTAFSKWDSSIKHFQKSKELSLAMGDQLIASFADLDAELAKAKELSSDQGSIDKIKSQREKVATAIELVKQGKIRDAFLLIEKIRQESSQLVNDTISPKVSQEIQLAEEKIKSAEQAFLQLDPNVDDESFKEEFHKAMDFLGAAKESLGFAKDLSKEDRYSESMQHSEEAGRLAYLAEEMSISLYEMQKKLPRKKEIAEVQVVEEKPIEVDIDHPLEDGIDDSKVISEKLENSTEKTNPENSITKKKTHKVSKKKPRETLSKIAKLYYGKASFWRKIYKANRKKIKNPNLIYPNQIFVLP